MHNLLGLTWQKDLLSLVEGRCRSCNSRSIHPSAGKESENTKFCRPKWDGILNRLPSLYALKNSKRKITTLILGL